MSGYLSLIVCLVGGILFLLFRKPEHADYKKLSEWAFAMGLLAFLIQEGGKAVGILK